MHLSVRSNMCVTSRPISQYATEVAIAISEVKGNLKR
jgi:hypothetical protein